jgi:hypothetical protein
MYAVNTNSFTAVDCDRQAAYGWTQSATERPMTTSGWGSLGRMTIERGKNGTNPVSGLARRQSRKLLSKSGSEPTFSRLLVECRDR